MRPAIKPGLIPVWRNRDTVQIGVDPRRAIALTGMRGAADLLALLDGSRDHSQVLAAAQNLGIGAATANRIITLLAAGGVLHDSPLLRDVPVELRSRLAPELATAALAHGDSDGGARTLVRRRAACIRVHGSGSIGLQLASLLDAAGIGQVISTGTAVQPGSVLPAPAKAAAARAGICGPAIATFHAGAPGPRPGRSGATRTRPALRRVPVPSQPRRRPDLVIVVDSQSRDLPAALVRDGLPHLAVSACEAIGVVGPLVIPGYSACLRCCDLARAGRDPAWPLILAQLTDHPAGPLGCDCVLAATVTAQAAAQALAFIDRGRDAAAATNGTLELVLPDWQWRRRTWRTHSRCDCGTHRNLR